MNPIFQWLMAHTIAKSQARRCPRCGRETVAPSTKAHDFVPCRKCGALLPPPPTKK